MGPSPLLKAVSVGSDVPMQYRRLGRTGLHVSSVGFGTSQLRRVSPSVAIDTLLRGFELGVNIVHSAPDYGGAEDYVAQALARTSKKVFVASNAYDVHGNRAGRVRHFETLFESTCRKLKTDRLDLFGIASVDDREALHENVWGRHGMVEFILRKKAQGRIGATICTSHGSPEFNRCLIESCAFDAIMISYNPLGFHLLSMTPTEDLPRNRTEIFPLCRNHDVGLMIMLPLAGGMLCKTDAFGPAQANLPGNLPARDVLQSILTDDAVSCVMPGTASVAEAEENARAGHLPQAPESHSLRILNDGVASLRSTLCSRCGQCELTCSQKLPVRWLHRAAYMSVYPNSPYETSDEYEYFRLHPALESTCATCPNVTCLCPAGIDVRTSLTTLHATMENDLARSIVAPPSPQRRHLGNRWFGARIIRAELPERMQPGRTHTCRLFLENLGLRPWHTPGSWHGSVKLDAIVNDTPFTSVDVRERIGRGRRAHFVFDIATPPRSSTVKLRLRLTRHHPRIPSRRGLTILERLIPVGEQ